MMVFDFKRVRETMWIHGSNTSIVSGRDHVECKEALIDEISVVRYG